MPLLSVITPVYNAQQYLNRCIQSVLNQSFTDFEYILINDGSTDTSLDICKEFAKKDGRIRIIDKKNEGVNKAIIDGISSSNTLYTTFLDADDWQAPQKFACLISAIQQAGADFAQCGTLINESTLSKELYSDKECIFNDIEGELLRPFFEQSASFYPVINSRWSKIYKTSLLKLILPSIDNGLVIGEDLAFNIWFLSVAKKGIVLKDSLYHNYRLHENSATRSFSQKKYMQIAKLPQALMEIAKKQGRTGKALQIFKDKTHASLMLDVCLSDFTITEKMRYLRRSKNEIKDIGHLRNLGKKHAVYIKIAIWFLSHGLFLPVVLPLAIIKPKRSTNEL